jgi:ribulose 1,5-bisphosphate synthetase/thiazole synthase
MKSELALLQACLAFSTTLMAADQVTLTSQTLPPPVTEQRVAELPNDPSAYDVVIYGGTSGGIVAAVQAARMGKRVVLVNPNQHLGGLTSIGVRTKFLHDSGWGRRRGER